MKFKQLILSIFFIVITSDFLFSQISEGGIPWGYSNDINDIEIIEMEGFNIRKAKKQSYDEKEQLKPLQYARTFNLNISINQYGEWKILKDGTKIWLIGLKSNKAYSIGIIFSEYELPPGSKLFIYNTKKTHYRGGFTEKNNKTSKRLTIAPVKGDEIIIEYQEPFDAEYKGKLTIGTLSHDYLDILNTATEKDGRYGLSGDCNIDINCEEGADWQEVKHAICRLHINSNKYCSGNLINNTAVDGTPYLITANHCVLNEGEADDILVVFNYESPYCNGPDGSVGQSISGATLRATSTNLDFSLIELSVKPPDSYKPYYVGWNNSSSPSAKVTSIHHPMGDVKKISYDDDTVKTGNSGSGYMVNSYWQVFDWELGTTEDGSSGSGLFDTNKRLIGVLSGGEANCSNSVNDFYTKFSLSWDYYYTDTNQNLKYWLDPLGTDSVELDGYNPIKPKYDYDIQLVKIISPDDILCGEFTFNPSCIIKNNGNDTVTSALVKYSINGIIEDSVIWYGSINTNFTDTIELESVELETGNYIITIELKNPNDTIDQNIIDNINSKGFEIREGQQVMLDLTTDNYGTETTWKITDSLNNTLYSGGPYANNVQNQITEYFCLDTGNYTFTIYDKMGDGICCKYGNGSYSIINLNDNQILETGGIFTDSAKVLIFIISPVYIANFSADQNNIIVNSSIQFYDNSINATSWLWYFEGGIPSSSTSQNPFVQYSDTGTFDVSLSINDSIDTKYVANYITVADSPSVADFYVKDSFICESATVQFINKSKKANSFSWSFEGGTPVQSTHSNPVILYENPGIYSVSLEINDTALKIKNNYIYVGAKPTISFSISAGNTTAEAIISGGTPPYNYYWNNNNLNTNIITNLKEGLYSVAIVDSVGCVVTAPFQIKTDDNIIKSQTLENESYRIFPNPSDGQIEIELLNTDFNKLEILDLHGKKLYEEAILSNYLHLNLKELEAGNYLLLLYQDNRISINKLIIIPK